jgi:hypothetical protein
MPGAEDDRDHTSGTRAMTFQGSGHLNTDAIVRRQEIGADQQEDDVRLLQLTTDCGVKIIPGDEATDFVSSSTFLPKMEIFAASAASLP